MTPNAWDDALASVLGEAEAAAKARRAEDLLADRDRLDLSKDPAVSPADRPARPSLPALVPPAEVPRRGLGTTEGRAALLHALAHIELNAVDLAADMALRFAAAVPGEHRAAFVRDWVQVAGEEGLHFRLLRSLLLERGFDYGAFPAHDGLWEAAQKTSGDLLGRLAIAPMILEARGLDVTPGLIRKLQGIGDDAVVEVLERIYRDEIGHVRIGVRWFTTLVSERGGDGGDAEETFSRLVGQYYPAGPKPPFNVWARDRAELPQDWYEGVVQS